MSEGVRKNLRHLFRPCPDQTTRTGGRRTKDREKESMKRLSSFGLDVRRLSRLGLILLPVLVGLAFLPACSGNGAKGNATTQAAAFVPTVSVTIGAATQETIPVERPRIGSVESYSPLTVKPSLE